jgi:hypothetical protein
MTTDYLGLLPAQPDRNVLRRVAALSRTAPLRAGGPAILSNPAEIARLMREGHLTKSYPRQVATARTLQSSTLTKILTGTLLVLDMPDHGYLRAAVNNLQRDSNLGSRVCETVRQQLQKLPNGVALDVDAEIGRPIANAAVATLMGLDPQSLAAQALSKLAPILNEVTSLDAGDSTPDSDEAAREAWQGVEDIYRTKDFDVQSHGLVATLAAQETTSAPTCGSG